MEYEKNEEGVECVKGFQSDLTCRGYRYELGGDYALREGETPARCERGFHACENPLDCLTYYMPSKSVYAQVTLCGLVTKPTWTGRECPEFDDFVDDTKRAASEIKIGDKTLTWTEFADLAKTRWEIGDTPLSGVMNTDNSFKSAKRKGVWVHATDSSDVSVTSVYSYSRVSVFCGRHSVASATNYSSLAEVSGGGLRNVAVSTGECSMAIADTCESAAVTTNYNSVSLASGLPGMAALSFGDGSVSEVGGYRSVAVAIGSSGKASAPGAQSIAVTLGDYGHAHAGKGSVAVAVPRSTASGKLGALLVFICPDGQFLTAVVDGELIWPDVPYRASFDLSTGRYSLERDDIEL